MTERLPRHSHRPPAATAPRSPAEITQVRAQKDRPRPPRSRLPFGTDFCLTEGGGGRRLAGQEWRGSRVPKETHRAGPPRRFARRGPTRQGPTRRPEGSSSKALLDGRTGPARRRERWRTPRRFGQVRTWSSSQPRPVLRMPPGMSALDRAWRQGRLGPFKGSDMPLGRRHVSPGPGLAPRAPRPVQGLRHAFGRSLPERERGSDVRVHGPGSGSGSRVQGPGSRSGSRVQGPRSRVQGPGSRVQGPG